MGSDDKLRVLQVYNISTAATNDLIKQLFQHFGRIDEFQVYPILVTAQTSQKVAYVRYEKEKSVVTAQHLTNTVFFDRALICVPTTTNKIPDEETALLNSAALGKRVLPVHVINEVRENEHGQRMQYTTDPNLDNLGLPPYPPLGADLDSEILEQTRRTIYIGNLKKDVDPEDVVKFFNTIGEVMYLKMANINEHHSCAYAYVEFTNQPSVVQALQNDGVEFQGQPVRIQHSRVAIVKPQQKTENQALEEIEEAIRRRDRGEPSPRRRATRSPSPPRRSRRRTRTPPRRSRSRGRDRERDRDSRKRDDRRDRDKDRKDDRSRKDDREPRRSRDRRRSRSPRKEKEEKKDPDVKSKSPKMEKEDRKDREIKSKSPRKEKEDRKDREIKKDEKKERRRSKDRGEKEKERRRSRSPRKDKDDKKDREKREKEKSGEKSSRHRSRDRESKKEKSREKVAADSTDEPMPSAEEELSLRERLLAKQKSKHRESDEMEISD